MRDNSGLVIGICHFPWQAQLLACAADGALVYRLAPA
jgi:hypothetical protein